MLSAAGHQRVFLATEPADMRGGFDRLSGRVVEAGFDVLAGDLFVFLSRRRTHLKVLTYDGTGLVVLYKRLSRGCFKRVEVRTGARTVVLDAAQLAALLDGRTIVGVGRSSPAGGGDEGIDAASGS